MRRRPRARLQWTWLAAVIVGAAGLAAWAFRPATDPLTVAAKGRPLSILVGKSHRSLTVLAGGSSIRAYRIALGRRPVGPKERDGDFRTPEGSYYVCARNPHSVYYRSFTLSYPNAQDAERGLRSRLITRKECKAIVRAVQRKGVPPQKTALGGDICIHGNGSSSDWTAGCIALDDGDMRELWDAIPLGTPVTIQAD